jgi:hypothetical protein
VRQLLAGLFRDLVKISFSKNKTQKTKYKEQGARHKKENPKPREQGTSNKLQGTRCTGREPKPKKQDCLL